MVLHHFRQYFSHVRVTEGWICRAVCIEDQYEVTSTANSGPMSVFPQEFPPMLKVIVECVTYIGSCDYPIIFCVFQVILVWVQCRE